MDEDFEVFVRKVLLDEPSPNPDNMTIEVLRARYMTERSIENLSSTDKHLFSSVVKSVLQELTCNNNVKNLESNDDDGNDMSKKYELMIKPVSVTMLDFVKNKSTTELSYLERSKTAEVSYVSSYSGSSLCSEDERLSWKKEVKLKASLKEISSYGSEKENNILKKNPDSKLLSNTIRMINSTSSDSEDILSAKNTPEKAVVKKAFKQKNSSAKTGGQIEKFKKYLNIAGIRVRNYEQLFKNCSTDKAKCNKIMEMLQTEGLKGKPTITKCKKLRKKIEIRKEFQELNFSNIASSTSKRRCKEQADGDWFKIENKRKQSRQVDEKLSSSAEEDSSNGLRNKRKRSRLVSDGSSEEVDSSNALRIKRKRSRLVDEVSSEEEDPFHRISDIIE